MLQDTELGKVGGSIRKLGSTRDERKRLHNKIERCLGSLLALRYWTNTSLLVDTHNHKQYHDRDMDNTRCPAYPGTSARYHVPHTPIVSNVSQHTPYVRSRGLAVRPAMPGAWMRGCVRPPGGLPADHGLAACACVPPAALVGGGNASLRASVASPAVPQRASPAVVAMVVAHVRWWWPRPRATASHAASPPGGGRLTHAVFRS